METFLFWMRIYILIGYFIWLQYAIRHPSKVRQVYDQFGVVKGTIYTLLSIVVVGVIWLPGIAYFLCEEFFGKKSEG